MRKRKRQKIKKRKIKKIARPKQAHLKIRWKRLFLVVIPFLFEKGLGLMGYSNPILGSILLCICGLSGWWFIYTSDWPNLRLMKVLNNKYIIVIVNLLIVLTFVITAFCIRGKKDISTQLEEILAEIQNDEEKRLNREYPLGYVMVAFSGENKVMIPSSGRVIIEGNMTVFVDSDNRIHVDNCNIYDKKGGSRTANCSFGGVRAIPGEKSVFFGMGSIKIAIECVKAKPIGIFAVLGFLEKN